MRIISSTLFFLSFLAVPVAAQSVFPPELRQYLSLTDDQKSAIEALESSFEAAWATSTARIAVLQAEIDAETARTAVDPHALGIRYAEIETLNRAIKAQYAKLRPASLDLLTDAQLAQMSALSDSANLFDLLLDAYWIGILVDPLSLKVQTPSGTVTFSECCGADSRTSKLIDYLSLTGSQLDSIDQLIVTSNLGYQIINDQQSILYTSVTAELAKDVLDVEAIGALYAEYEALKRKQNAGLADLATQSQALLTSAQAAKFKPLITADSRKLLIAEAACVNLLDFPAQLSYDTGIPSYTVAPAAGTQSRPAYGCGFFQ